MKFINVINIYLYKEKNDSKMTMFILGVISSPFNIYSPLPNIADFLSIFIERSNSYKKKSFRSNHNYLTKYHS